MTALLTPACGALDPGTVCNPAQFDPGVFKINNDAVGVGAPCSGITFTETPNVVTGQVLFTPTTNFTLPVNSKCTIAFTVDVVGPVTKDFTPGNPPNTEQIASGSAISVGNPSTGFAGGTGTDNTVVNTCIVAVDKQISCDGGANYVDNLLISSAGPADQIAETCTAVLGKNVNFLYKAQNLGTAVPQCTFVDAQTGSAGVKIFSLDAPFELSSTLTQLNPNGTTQACSKTFGDNEPNTGKLSCQCVDSITIAADDTTFFTVDAQDSAKAICAPPNLELTKLCDPQSGTTNAVTLTAKNTGQVVLNSCVLTDTYYPTSPLCPPPTTAVGTPLDLTSVGSFTLGIAGGGSDSKVVNSSISNLAADTCNTAHVDCVVGSTTDHITADANDVCEVRTGCFTRTIGYWGTHPNNTSKVLLANGGGVSSCGLNLTTVNLSNTGPFSTSQDLCSNGQDSKGAGASPLQTSLIRQCAGAAINLAASKSAGLGCGTDEGAGTILSTFATCCGVGGVCATGGTALNNYDLAACNSAIGAFNESFDDQSLPSFLTNEKAQPQLYCQIARGDGKMNTGAGRTYKTK